MLLHFLPFFFDTFFLIRGKLRNRIGYPKYALPEIKVIHIWVPKCVVNEARYSKVHILDEEGVLSAAVIMRKAAYTKAAHVARSEHRDNRRNILQRKKSREN